MYSKDFSLRDQIQRAAISVMSNIAEGFHAGSNAEFLRFLGYSRRSVAEMQSQLYTALDLSYVNQETFDEVFAISDKTFRQINAFISYLRRYKNKRVAEDPADYTLMNTTKQTNLTNKTNATKQTSKNKLPNSKNCFVCGLENEHGLHLNFYQTESGDVVVDYEVPDHFQGYPGVVHGGIVASLVDEVLGRVHIGPDPQNPRFMFTAKMTVNYRKNVPTGKPIKIVGRAVNSKRRTATSVAEIFGPDGELLAEAEALLVDVPAEKLEDIDMDALGWKVYPGR